MAIAQDQPVSPPVQLDFPGLISFAGIIQRNMSALYQAAHFHVGNNGPITAAPKATDGTAGDITIGVISGVVYLFVKIDRSHWVKFGPGTAI